MFTFCDIYARNLELTELQIHASMFQDFWPIAVGALLTTVTACIIIIIKVLY